MPFHTTSTKHLSCTCIRFHTMYMLYAKTFEKFFLSGKALKKNLFSVCIYLIHMYIASCGYCLQKILLQTLLVIWDTCTTIPNIKKINTFINHQVLCKLCISSYTCSNMKINSKRFLPARGKPQQNL